MSKDYLATYLNDHLAGSVLALELLEHLRSQEAGKDDANVLALLYAEIENDQRELKALMQKLDIEDSRPRKITGWLSEKATELKLKIDDPSGGALRLFESFELISLGIEGKRTLWRTLSSISSNMKSLQNIDYNSLISRAEQQRDRVEMLRMKAARSAFL